MSKFVEQSHELVFPANRSDFIVEMKAIERLGRIAYQSDGLITDDSYAKFIAKIRNRNHGAVLEHGVMKAIFITNRGVTHEFVRHRLMSPTQESTRFCNYSKDKFNNEITFIKPNWIINLEKDPSKADICNKWYSSLDQSGINYLKLLENGVTPQLARSVLPNELKTQIGITANFREWQHIFQLRCLNADAHPDIRSLLKPLYDKVRVLCPEVFDMGEPS